MLEALSIAIMLAVAYALMVEGLFTALCMLVNVFVAGLLAFNFYEPIATWAEANVTTGTFLGGYEDAFVLVALFWGTLAALRVGTNHLAPAEVSFQPMVQRIGGTAVGLLTGYLLAGFLVCVCQTIPFHVHFMSFDPSFESDGKALRRLLPPDRVWLALMHRAGLAAFASGNETFDNEGNFELRYARYRRYEGDTYPLPYYGEFDRDLFQGASGMQMQMQMPQPSSSTTAPATKSGPTTPATPTTPEGAPKAGAPQTSSPGTPPAGTNTPGNPKQ